MAVAGMITEYNPLHGGHLHLIREARRRLGADTAVIACMSGDFVQRGDLAVARRQARSRAAVMSGADLVLELPLPWAVSSAEGFADGGVAVLLATGVVSTLLFGSECGDTAALQRAAAVLLREDFPLVLKEELAAGVSFPAARERAVERMAGREAGAVLRRPNDLLGVEYCKSLLRRRASVQPVAVLRQGGGHGDVRPEAGASSSAIRALLRAGERERALNLMAEAMRVCFLEEEAAGRAPVLYETVQRAALMRLRSMSRENFAALDEGREGLFHRLYAASRAAASLPEVLDRAATKRYPRSRLRRMILWACLGLEPARRPAAPLYLRPLAMNGRGRELLSQMRKSAALPVLTKAAHVRRLGPEALALLELEARAADLYAFSFPRLSAARPGSLWREGPWIAPGEGIETNSRSG